MVSNLKKRADLRLSASCLGLEQYKSLLIAEMDCKRLLIDVL